MVAQPMPKLTVNERWSLLASRHAQAHHRQQHRIKRMARQVSPALAAAIDRCRLARGLEPLY